MYRIERDALGEVQVDDSVLWGAQTQRSLQNFPIGDQVMPDRIINAFAYIKKAAAQVNRELGNLAPERAEAIATACDAVLGGTYADQFPLKVWQTGSGTQTNMNVNEVLAHIANRDHDFAKPIHPNDDCNRSQSSNDTFPTAMHVAAVMALTADLLPAIDVLASTFEDLSRRYWDVIKIGRTHLQDATPVRFGQEVSAWAAMLRSNAAMVEATLPFLRAIALGGTAVGTGLNCPEGFDVMVATRLGELTGQPFVTSPNKFHALTSKDAFVFAAGALSALAANMMKIANDVRWLASGPRCGLGEITIPANEPGSSIMPGKVNPTQCESMTMVATQVMSNMNAITMGASQGNFQLNVFMPVIAYDFLQSVRLLADSLVTFEANCARGIEPNTLVMADHLERSLMLVTCLAPSIGYDAASKIAKKAHAEGTTLRQAAIESGYISAEDFDAIVRPESMVG